jgi:hypothetical protein
MSPASSKTLGMDDTPDRPADEPTKGVVTTDAAGEPEEVITETSTAEAAAEILRGEDSSDLSTAGEPKEEKEAKK